MLGRPNQFGTLGPDIASTGTITLGTTAGFSNDVTGTTTITSLGTADEGVVKVVQFDGALTLTHNGTSLILPGAANITTAAGDIAMFYSLGSGNWRCILYTRMAAPPQPGNGQYSFPATQNPSSDANTLDDYEEGTWTVSFTFQTAGNLALSAETKEAYYLKIGQQVKVYWHYAFTPTFTTSSGAARITGLPFTHKDVTNAQCLGRGALRHNANVAYGAGNTNIHVHGVDNQTFMAIVTQGTASAASDLQTAGFTSAVATELHGSLVYQASA